MSHQLCIVIKGSAKSTHLCLCAQNRKLCSHTTMVYTIHFFPLCANVIQQLHTLHRAENNLSNSKTFSFRRRLATQRGCIKNVHPHTQLARCDFHDAVYITGFPVAFVSYCISGGLIGNPLLEAKIFTSSSDLCFTLPDTHTPPALFDILHNSDVSD